MNDDLNISQDSAPLPESDPAGSVSQAKENQVGGTDGESDSPQTANKPRIKGSHRSGTPPKLKWL